MAIRTSTASVAQETILIIGPGRVGTTLSRAAQTKEFMVLGAVTHAETQSAALFQTDTGLPVRVWEDTVGVNEWLIRASLVIICVPDREITHIVAKLADASVLSPGTCVVHTAGSLGVAELEPLRRTAVLLGAMHPLQSFADPKIAVTHLPTTFVGIEAAGPALIRIEDFARTLGLQPFILGADNRVRYHAAAVLASNAITALAYSAQQLLPEDVPLAAILPLMQGAVENLSTVGLPHALTGPIDRGDVATVQRHIQNIDDWNPDVAPVYRVLSQVMLTLATQKNVLTTEQIDALQLALQSSKPPRRQK